MKKRKRMAAAALFAVLFVCAGCQKKAQFPAESGLEKGQENNEEDFITVGVAQIGAESDWRNANTQSIRSALSQENGFRLIFEDAQQKQENQIKSVRKFILQEVDYIVLLPIVETGWEGVLQEAKEAGIPVILADRMADVNPSLYTCWVGSDFEKEGQEAGRWLEKYLQEKGVQEEEIKIVTLQGTLGATAQIGRTKGFAEVLKEHPNWKMLEQENGDFTQTKGQEVMEHLLREYEKIDVLISENDNMTFGAMDAMKKYGRSFGKNGDITVLSFDAVDAALEAMQKGEINVDFECNPLHGEKLSQIIRSLEKGETVEKLQYLEETWFDCTMDLEKIREDRTY